MVPAQGCRGRPRSTAGTWMRNPSINQTPRTTGWRASFRRGHCDSTMKSSCMRALCMMHIYGSESAAPYLCCRSGVRQPLREGGDAPAGVCFVAGAALEVTRELRARLLQRRDCSRRGPHDLRRLRLHLHAVTTGGARGATRAARARRLCSVQSAQTPACARAARGRRSTCTAPSAFNSADGPQLQLVSFGACLSALSHRQCSQCVA